MTKHILAATLAFFLMISTVVLGAFYVYSLNDSEENSSKNIPNNPLNLKDLSAGTLNAAEFNQLDSDNKGTSLDLIKPGSGTKLIYENECSTKYDCEDDEVCVDRKCERYNTGGSSGSRSRDDDNNDLGRCRYDRDCGKKTKELSCYSEKIIKTITSPTCNGRTCATDVDKITLEDCNSKDSWYDTGETKWIDEGQCKEKKLKRQEYRDYNCSAGKEICSYSVTNGQWVEQDIVDKANGTSCDDGLFCTENDKCNAGNCQGSVKSCDDSIGCTVDSCNEVIDKCINKPSDDLCNDGLYCNGIETCNPSSGCQARTSVDCSIYNILGVATCFNAPDNNPFTWDFRNAFASKCKEKEGGYYCTKGDSTITRSCNKEKCGAECLEGESVTKTCSQTYYDYCESRKLIEYDNNKKKDSTTVTGSCVSKCKDCKFPDCEVGCDAPNINKYFVKDVCGAECEVDNHCPADYNSENYCRNGNVYKDVHDFSCEQGGCDKKTTTKLVESCTYGCSNGKCIDQKFEWEIICSNPVNNNNISVQGCCGDCKRGPYYFLRIYKLKEVGYYYFKDGNKIKVLYGQGYNICKGGGPTSGSGAIPSGIVPAGHYTTWDDHGRVFTLFSDDKNAAITCGEGANITSYFWEDGGSPGDYNDGRIIFKLV